MDTKVRSRVRRHRRVRKKITGTAERPRLAVFRSNKHIYAQLIDDLAGRTLVAASSVEGEIAKDGDKKSVAGRVGKVLGERAKERGITSIVFDRGGRLYQGRVQSLAEAARETGLKF
ncbi:MAG: 50S ribosomal protein L18 [Actinomycetota bacterium]|nr:50S ribosomal protein L18 [Actinomycetota bacterium]